MTRNEVTIHNKIGECVIHHSHAHVLRSASGKSECCSKCSLSDECFSSDGLLCLVLGKDEKGPFYFEDVGLISSIIVEQWNDEDPTADRLRRDCMETGPENAFDPDAK